MEEADLERSFFADLTVLCSERLNQMTKTYDDLEAVTRLLEEKEKDLELAAKIGKSLLERNKELQQTNEFLEEQLNGATDQLTQLKHELHQKIDLLHIYTDTESADSGGSTPANERFSNWGLLQRKIRLLEEENVALKLEANHLKTLTQGLEEKEQQLLTDCMKQIGDSNIQIEMMGAELIEKQEQCEVQQKQLNRLLKEMVDKSTNEKLVRCDNEELTVRLRAAHETQAELAQELLDLQERYAEVVAMLTESREEVKLLREKAAANRFGSCGPDDSLYDSLASELEASDSGYSAVGGRDRYYGARNELKNEQLRRQSQDRLIHVMETVRNCMQKEELKETEKQKKALDDQSSAPLTISVVPSDSSGQSSAMSNAEFQTGILSPRTAVNKAKGILQEVEYTLSPIEERMSRVASNESLCSYPGPGIGVPGIPGTKDLEFAIRRLTLRRRVELEYARYRSGRSFIPQPSSFQRSFAAGHSSSPQSPSSSTIDTTPKLQSKRSSMPVPIRSRLMLVKSVEGSDTMAHWKELATPGGIDSSSWEKRPGIKVKGGNGFSPPLASTAAKDASTSTDIRIPTPTTDSRVSSDAETPKLPFPYMSPYFSSGRMSTTPGTFSFVTSRILHPNEANTTVGISSNSSPRSSISSSPPRDDGTSTFSTALNLAHALGERCVDLMTGGWLASRQSPMTIPKWQSSEMNSEHSTVPDRAATNTTRIHSNVADVSLKDDIISGLESLAEESGPNTGFNVVEQLERSPEKRPGSDPDGIVIRTSMKPVK